jgi:hypothetical protein
MDPRKFSQQPAPVVQERHRRVLQEISPALNRAMQPHTPQSFANLRPMQQQYSAGGLATDGGGIDPVSGNPVPVGSNPVEVRDDIEASVSEGEYVVPADVVRYYGVKFFEDLRQEAKSEYAQMDSEGRVGGEAPMVADVPDPEDPYELAAMINSGEEEPVEMFLGGLMGGLFGGGGSSSSASGPANKSVSAPSPDEGKTTTSQFADVTTGPKFVPEDYAVVGSSLFNRTGRNQNITYMSFTNGTDTIQIPFLNGEPLIPIPDGYWLVGSNPQQAQQAQQQSQSSRGDGAGVPMWSRSRTSVPGSGGGGLASGMGPEGYPQLDLYSMSPDELMAYVRGSDDLFTNSMVGDLGVISRARAAQMVIADRMAYGEPGLEEVAASIAQVEQSTADELGVAGQLLNDVVAQGTMRYNQQQVNNPASEHYSNPDQGGAIGPVIDRSGKPLSPAGQALVAQRGLAQAPAESLGLPVGQVGSQAKQPQPLWEEVPGGPTSATFTGRGGLGSAPLWGTDGRKMDPQAVSIVEQSALATWGQGSEWAKRTGDPMSHIIVYSGADGHSANHGAVPSGIAAAGDYQIVLESGRMVPMSDPSMEVFGVNFYARGGQQLAFGPEYMGGTAFHAGTKTRSSASVYGNEYTIRGGSWTSGPNKYAGKFQQALDAFHKHGATEANPFYTPVVGTQRVPLALPSREQVQANIADKQRIRDKLQQEALDAQKTGDQSVVSDTQQRLQEFDEAHGFGIQDRYIEEARRARLEKLGDEYHRLIQARGPEALVTTPEERANFDKYDSLAKDVAEEIKRADKDDSILTSPLGTGSKNIGKEDWQTFTTEIDKFYSSQEEIMSAKASVAINPVTDTARYFMKRLIEHGYTPEQAAGAVGSMEQESASNTGTLDPSSINKIGAVGVAQWLGPRRRELEALAAQRGTTIFDPVVQADHMINELRTTEKRTDTAMRNATTAAEASRIWTEKFERPHASEMLLDKRAGFANGHLGRWNQQASSAAGQSVSISPADLLIHGGVSKTSGYEIGSGPNQGLFHTVANGHSRSHSANLGYGDYSHGLRVVREYEFPNSTKIQGDNGQPRWVSNGYLPDPSTGEIKTHWSRNSAAKALEDNGSGTLSPAEYDRFLEEVDKAGGRLKMPTDPSGNATWTQAQLNDKAEAMHPGINFVNPDIPIAMLKELTVSTRPVYSALRVDQFVKDAIAEKYAGPSLIVTDQTAEDKPVVSDTGTRVGLDGLSKDGQAYDAAFDTLRPGATDTVGFSARDKTTSGLMARNLDKAAFYNKPEDRFAGVQNFDRSSSSGYNNSSNATSGLGVDRSGRSSQDSHSGPSSYTTPGGRTSTGATGSTRGAYIDRPSGSVSVTASPYSTGSVGSSGGYSSGVSSADTSNSGASSASSSSSSNSYTGGYTTKVADDDSGGRGGRGGYAQFYKGGFVQRRKKK